ncbi:MAG TPA: hypothetical protein VJ011_01945 [Steroidobacteraceae bacterium]|nr:hypothetical protein [Steroidobacteraceae bacterium]
MSDAELRKLVREKLSSGLLPRDAARQVLARYGKGETCDVCGRPTPSSGVVYEMRLFHGMEARSGLMDLACFDAWQQERRIAQAASRG